MKLGNQKGFGLIEVIIASSIAVATIGVLASAVQQVGKINRRAGVGIALASTQLSLLSTLQDESSWQETKSQNTDTMECIKQNTDCDAYRDQDTPFVLYDKNGDVLVDAKTDPTSGLTYHGTDCTGFEPTLTDLGNSNCPLRLEVTWTPSCAAGTVSGDPCINPAVWVDVKFLYNPGAGAIPLNTASFDFRIKPGVSFQREYKGDTLGERWVLISHSGSPELSCGGTDIAPASGSACGDDGGTGGGNAHKKKHGNFAMDNFANATQVKVKGVCMVEKDGRYSKVYMEFFDEADNVLMTIDVCKVRGVNNEASVVAVESMYSIPGRTHSIHWMLRVEHKDGDTSMGAYKSRLVVAFFE